MANFANISEGQIYVGTYKKYNEGSLQGAWLQVADYSDKEEFLEACRELHSDEKDPELMFQDFENIPDSLIGESWIDEKVWDFIELIDDHSIDTEALGAYFDLGLDSGKDDADDIISDFEERYEGHFDSLYDFGYHWYECGVLCDIPENVINYFDFERYGRDVAYDYSESDGYYFRNY
jgi:antirestriction protein